MLRGEIWWADLPEPVASEPGFRRPVLIISADSFNCSSIQTVLAAVFTGNLRLTLAPGNVLVSAEESGLPRDSVLNVSQVLTVDKSRLTDRVGVLNDDKLARVEQGLRIALAL